MDRTKIGGNKMSEITNGIIDKIKKGKLKVDSLESTNGTLLLFRNGKVLRVYNTGTTILETYEGHFISVYESFEEAYKIIQ